MGNPIVFFEVLGRDRDALKGFYSDLFGWKADDVPGPMEYSIVAPGGETGIPGGIGKAPEGTSGHVTCYVGVDDVKGALDRAQSLGGQTVLPPMDIPGGQIGLLADPEGHVVGVWRGDAEDGGERAGRGVLHFEVIGGNGDSLRSFYGDLFGWKIQKVPGEMDYGIIDRADNGGGIGGGVGEGAASGGPGYVTFYVGVDDLQQTLDRAQALGGKTVAPPMDVTGGPAIAQLSDPEGHTIGIVREPAAGG
jgi:predicted enzyme related to lactoylglutathione lyase